LNFYWTTIHVSKLLIVNDGLFFLINLTNVWEKVTFRVQMLPTRTFATHPFAELPVQSQAKYYCSFIIAVH